MALTKDDLGPEDIAPSLKRKEWRLFLFIVVFLFPLLSVAIVGGYGFAIWMYQLLMGPPGAG